MRLPHQAILSLTLAACVLSGTTRPVFAGPPAAAKSSLKPDVAALLQQSTAAYKKMRSYRHTALYVVEGINPASHATIRQEYRFTLALDRPNKFVYRADTEPVAAAVSDGKTFINFRGQQSGENREYTQQNAPADYKGIDIVNAVNFDPLGTYLIALMLQGDLLADKDVKSNLEKATLKPTTVTENGKKWQVMTTVFSTLGPTEIYFHAESHLIGKVVLHPTVVPIKITETYADLSIDKPIDPAVFHYTVPQNAKRLDKLTPITPPKVTPIQKPDDARNTPHRNSGSALAQLSADRKPTTRI